MSAGPETPAPPARTGGNGGPGPKPLTIGAVVKQLEREFPEISISKIRYLEDQGSLNGTFLNRKRIESGKLENGDELQIGKYKLTFLEK